MMKAFLLAVILSVAAYTSTARAAEARPNIVVILADDMGVGDVQALSPDRARSRRHISIGSWLRDDVHRCS